MSTLKFTQFVINKPSSSPSAHITLPTPPSLSPIPQAHHRKAAAYGVVPKYSGALSLLSPLPTPPELSSIPRAHLPLPDPCRCCRFRSPVSVTLPTQS